MSSIPSSSDRHVVVGAGPVGRHVAAELAARGSHITVVTRSGRDTGLDGVTHLALDASDADTLTRVAEGTDCLLYTSPSPRDS